MQAYLEGLYMKGRDKDERTTAEHNQDSYKADPPKEDRRVRTFGGDRRVSHLG
jgi:hypothetical protein